MLSQRLGQNVVIDNRSGAGGTLGAQLAAKSPADGYTLVMITTSPAFNVSLYRQLPYDMVRDLAPIALVATAPNMLVVTASLPVATVKDFVALARARTPRAVMEKLNREIVQSMQLPDMRARLAGQGAEPRTSTPEEFAVFPKTEISKYSRLAKEMGVQPE